MYSKICPIIIEAVSTNSCIHIDFLRLLQVYPAVAGYKGIWVNSTPPFWKEGKKWRERGGEGKRKPAFTFRLLGYIIFYLNFYLLCSDKICFSDTKLGGGARVASLTFPSSANFCICLFTWTTAERSGIWALFS